MLKCCRACFVKCLDMQTARHLAPWVVIMTAWGAAGDVKAVGLATFDLQWRCGPYIRTDLHVCVCDCIVQFYLQMYSIYIYRINDFWFWFRFMIYSAHSIPTHCNARLIYVNTKTLKFACGMCTIGVGALFTINICNSVCLTRFMPQKLQTFLIQSMHHSSHTWLVSSNGHTL